MNKLDQTSTKASFQVNDKHESSPRQESTLRSEVEKSLQRFFQYLEDEPVTDLHQMVMAEVEAPLLEAIMRHTGNNQSKASIMLGLNRGTLRTKLKQYGLL
jgi:Fis family transcriptional regulator, factor for inversion stimulation protein